MRVIQVGLGGWGRSWAELVSDSKGVELVGAVDQDPEARRWASEELGLALENCHESLDQAFTGTDCDAVLAITPPVTHHAVATEALAAGKHVMVEKPLASNLREARSLVEKAAEAGRILSVSQNYRFTRPARALRRLIANGAIGELINVKIAFRRDTRDLFPAGDFRYSMRHPFVQDMAIHHFDLLRALTGEDIVSIYGQSWRVPDSPYEYDPSVAALLTLENGASVTYEGDWATHGFETSWNGEWEISGEKGRLIWTGDLENRNIGEVVLELWGEHSRPVEQMQLPNIERAATLQQLREAVERGSLPETNAADNLNSLAAVLGCMESIESGGLVNMNEILLTSSEPERN